MCTFNTLRPRQNGHHLPDDLFKHIFLNENIMISIKISLKFVCKGRINNIPSLVHIMAWHRPGDKPLSESVMFSLLAHICVRRPQWVKCSVVLNIEWPFAGEKNFARDFLFTNQSTDAGWLRICENRTIFTTSCGWVHGGYTVCKEPGLVLLL